MGKIGRGSSSMMRLSVFAFLMVMIVAAPAWAAATADGGDLFHTRCGVCHSAGGFGTSMLARRLGAGKSVLEDRVDLTPAYVTVAVRRGVGGMPPFSRVELTDPELRA